MRHVYSDEEKQFIIDNVKGISLIELTDRFNKKFGTKLTERAMQSMKAKLGVKSDYHPTMFVKGQPAHNKGVPMSKEQYEKCKKTMFKKGNLPTWTYEVGTELVIRGGYTVKKIAQPDVWKPKARYIYEKAYGELPSNMQVIFANGDKKDFSLDNLIALTKKEMLIINQFKLKKSDKDLTKSGVQIAKLIAKIREKSKGENQ